MMMTLLIEKRIKAFSIDASLATIGFLIALQISNTNFILGRILLFTTFLGVYVLPYFSATGQSLGKRFQQIRVVKMDGTKAGSVRLIIRSLTLIVTSIVSAGIYIVVATLFKNKEDELWHDKLFHTKVIMINEKKNEV